VKVKPRQVLGATHGGGVPVISVLPLGKPHPGTEVYRQTASSAQCLGFVVMSR